MSLTAEQPPKDILFEHEEDVLRNALTRLREGESGSGEWPKTYGDLTAEYEALVKAQRRLVRLSDRQQNQLNQLTRKAKDLAEDLKQANELLTGSNRHLEDIQLKLSRYIPRQLLDKILAGEKDVQIGGQRKKLTVFFSDIAGFTEINDRIEPEELTQVLNHYLNEMSGIAVAHGATIDKYIGDAIMGFFGDPSSHGARQDASACVAMALAMQARMVELRQQWEDDGFPFPFRIRIGINTGYCTVGNFGSDDRVDYTIIGREVNLASRLQSCAEPDEIVASFTTYALVKKDFVCEKGDLEQVKGFVHPVQTYKIRGAAQSGADG